MISVISVRHRPLEAGRQIVEHHHTLAGIDQRVNHVASDIAGPAGDQDRHAVLSHLTPEVSDARGARARASGMIFLF
jgi:hypothetical protein